MTYIILAAGKGSRLYPLTMSQPKVLYKLDKSTSVIQRMTSMLQKYDSNSKIIIVTGFANHQLEKDVKGVEFIHNPFYSVTNSIASLWFAQDYLEDDNVTIINGDIVMEERLYEIVLCKNTSKPIVFLDSSISHDGDYNAQVCNSRVVVMSKELNEYFGEYAGVTKLDKESARLLKIKIIEMVNSGAYDQWYENALVQMIFNEDFNLYYKDISEYNWTEIDCVSDMLLAKKIHYN